MGMENFRFWNSWGWGTLIFNYLGMGILIFKLWGIFAIIIIGDPKSVIGIPYPRSWQWSMFDCMYIKMHCMLINKKDI